MKVTIKCWERNPRKKQITKAVEIINGSQNYFYLNLELTDLDVVDAEKVNWNLFCKEISVEENEYIIFVTEKKFDDNWFSHEERQFALISTNEWEEVFAPPSLKAYLVYQIAQAIMFFIGDINERMAINIVHDYPEGCMFDLCMNKDDIKFGMISGNICPKCKSTLVRYGINEKAIYAVECMLKYVRSEAIGKPIISNPNAAFVVMRFSENDENDHAYKYGIKPALQELNIECIRADNQISSGQILDKIRRNIEMSRFVIVKVDSKNLNVYFELGLALGMNKDVLMISENNLVLTLPSDIKNWECLTYQKGNYDELKNNIISFFMQNYFR